MDKEAFLYQLELAVTNDDKKLFIDTIFDLPAGVIVGFTKEEFSRIITISRQIDLHEVDELFSFLGDEGLFALKKALEGIDELNNFLISKFYYSLSLSLVVNNIKIIKAALLNNSLVCCKLAEMGIDSSENFGITLRLCENAKKILPKGSRDYAGALSTEGLAFLKMGEMGVDCRKNFEAAIRCCGTAQEIFYKESPDYARALMNEGTARLDLAKTGVAIRENLETAILCYDTAKEILTKKGADYAGLLINNGLAKQGLAELGVETKENLVTAVSLFEASRKILPKISSVYAKSLMNEGNARRSLSEMNIEPEENFKMAMKLYIESISVYEKIGDGWTYSIALLNLNNLLKLNFYKTGNIKYFEEWEKYIGDIDEMIKSRDLMHKDLLITRIHEIRASLLEFKGKSGISDASFEYYEAYKISKEPFFKFMKEFCQARNGEKSFCELAADWKKVEKKFIFLDYDIFLDYYDYSIFECHMENALKSTIDEEDELKHAVKKLKEIRDRTQIKLIRDRVSAYIYLLQALVDCFTKDSYNEASENINAGCRIFREHGDKQGQQTCEIFHNAVVKNRDPNAWYNIIRNREFSSNFYSLLCEYSDRKRTNLEFYRFGQMTAEMNTMHSKVDTISGDLIHVKEISIRTENKLDEIQNTLKQIHSEFVVIKDQIEEGFDGTAKELREIKGVVNKIEKDLEILVQSSKDMDGKEGECIRLFAAKIIELMKKGDCEALKRFIEKIDENEASLEEIIEKSKAPEQEKADAKLRLADFKKIPGILKEKTKSFGKDVAKDVVVTLTAEEIVKLLVPMLSTAVFGVPIPSKIVEILFSAVN